MFDLFTLVTSAATFDRWAALFNFLRVKVQVL